MSNLLKDCNNNSRRLIALLSSKKTYKMIKWVIILSILCLISTSHWSTCPSSSSSSNVITSEQYIFSEYTNTFTNKVALGPVSASLYYLYYVSTPGSNWAIRKTNPDGSLAWVAALSLYPVKKSLSVDTLEQYVYVASFTNPMDVTRLGAGTGAIVDAQR